MEVAAEGTLQNKVSEFVSELARAAYLFYIALTRWLTFVALPFLRRILSVRRPN